MRRWAFQATIYCEADTEERASGIVGEALADAFGVLFDMDPLGEWGTSVVPDLNDGSQRAD